MNTCHACRARKVKCDGTYPRCGPCARARRPIDCNYDEPSMSPPPGSLKKGAACYPCRRKKKRCDAQRPSCTACTNSGTQSECQYDSSEVIFARNWTPESFSSPGVISSSSSRHTEDWGAHDIRSNSGTSSDSSDKAAVRITPSAGTFEDSLFNYRSTFLENCSQLGVYFPEFKKQAILAGDGSGNLVHPSFIPLAHLFGHVYQLRRNLGQTIQLQEEEAHLRTTLATFSQTDPGNSSIIDVVRAHTLIAMYHLRSSNADEGIRLLKRTKHSVDAQGFRFLLPAAYNGLAAGSQIIWRGSPEDTVERVTALAQLIFVEVIWDLMTQQSSPCSELERQFRQELLPAYPDLMDSPILLRTRSILFVKDLNQVISMYNRSADWLAVSQQLIYKLSGHISTLFSLCTRLGDLQERGPKVSLRYSAIICLGSLAELNRFLSLSAVAHIQDFPTACGQALQRMAQVTQGLEAEDFYHLDRFIGTCWTKAMNVALGLCSEASSGNSLSESLKSCIIVMSGARDTVARLL